MRNTVSARIAAELERDIDAGAFDGAGRFPTERELADRFAVARNTVRRAMDALEESGRISRQVGRGTFITGTGITGTGITGTGITGTGITGTGITGMGVTGPGGAPAADAMAALHADISPRDLIEARFMIEPAAAASAAANATDADIARLMQCQEASRATDIMEEFERQDAEIHRLLFAMTHNQLVQRIDAMIRSMRNNADWLAAKRRAYSADLKARYVDQHGAIIDAVRRRSPKAAREAMTVHLEEVRRALLES